MNRRFVIYGIIASATATAVSALVYAFAKWRLAASLEMMEATSDQVSSSGAILRFSLLFSVCAAVVTGAMFLRYLSLKDGDAE